LTKRHKKQHESQTPRDVPAKVWTLVFLVVLLSTQLVNLDRDVIYLRPRVLNNDESTFILMASGLLHGQLPYVDLYDIKPPGLFLVLAGVMSLFGESLSVVRHFGTFCLLVAAVASYGIVLRHTTSWVAGLSIAALMTLTGVPDFQSTMAETVAIAMLMPALWLLVARRGVLWAVCLVGVLVSSATLVRTNVAYVALALAGYYLWRWWRGRPEVSLWEPVVYGAGGLMPLVLSVWVYWRADALDEFMFVNVMLIGRYAYGQLGAMHAFWYFVDVLLSQAFVTRYAFLITVFIIGGLCLWVVNGKKARLWEDSGPLVLVFGALGLSILQSGQGHMHYLLQLFPLVAVFTTLGFGTLTLHVCWKGKAAWVGVALSVLVLIAGLMRYGSESVNHVVSQWDSLGRTPLQRVADLIREDDGGGKVFAPTHHLIYWYLNQPPPSKVVHPDLLYSLAVPGGTFWGLVEHGYLSKDEFQRVVAGDYDYIVLATDVSAWQFMHPSIQEWFDKRLARDYVRWKEVPAFPRWEVVPGFVIYKRR